MTFIGLSGDRMKIRLMAWSDLKIQEFEGDSCLIASIIKEDIRVHCSKVSMTLLGTAVIECI